MRYIDLLSEDHLFEIKMTGKSLQRLASAVDGVKIGL